MMKLPRLTSAFFALSLALSGPAAAQTQPATLAQAGLAARIEALSADSAANGFEIGLLSVLRAAEKSLQTRFEYGLGQRLTGLPMLRLRMGTAMNPTPKQADAQTLSRIVDTMIDDMRAAQAVLSQAERDGINAFELDLQDIWFDMNLNGTRDKGEDAAKLLAPALLDWRTRRDLEKSGALDAPLVVRFDAADHAWLMAYTHLLAGVGNAFMAFDPAPILADLDAKRMALADAPRIPNFYDQDAVQAEIAALTARRDDIQAREKEMRGSLAPFNEQLRKLRDDRRTAETETHRKEIDTLIEATRDAMKPVNERLGELRRETRLLRNEIKAAEGKLAQPEEEVFTQDDIAALRREMTEANRQREALRGERTALQTRRAELITARSRAETQEKKLEITRELDKVQAALAQNRETDARLLAAISELEKRGTEMMLAMRQRPAGASLEQFRPTVDTLYVVLAALGQQPDRARLQAARSDWLGMIAHNRVFWQRLAEETDNRREWLPNASQQSALGIEVPGELADAWQNILDDAEAVLEGRLLLPHPLVSTTGGINLAAYFADPAPIDLIEWIHGIGAYPYVAKGPKITSQNWQAFSRLTRGRAAAFALYFN